MNQYVYTILDIKYEQINIDQSEYVEPTMDEINQLASQGWRLVATIPRILQGPTLCKSAFIFEKSN
jgi:hypothetical protein